MIWVGEIMTLQNKSLQPATMVPTRSLSLTDFPILVSIEGLYQQQTCKIGNGQYIFLAAKIRNASQNNSDKITTLFLQQARQMAGRSQSLPLNQGPTVHDVGPSTPDSALFGYYNTTNGEYGWFVISYGPNTGQGAPGGSIAFDQNGQQFNAGGWVCWPITDQASTANFFLHYADDDAGGIAGAFNDTCS
jgi:hypothetical protein